MRAAGSSMRAAGSVQGLLSLQRLVFGAIMFMSCGEQKHAGKAETLKFKPPVLTDEDSHSRFLAEDLKCDACKAIAYQFYTNFMQFNKLNKHYNYELPESEILDLTEKICEVSTFERYGVKEVDGVNRITGPGVETEGAPGMIAGGGKWPGRLVEMCSSLVEIVGEEKIYNTFKKKPTDEDILTKFLCHGRGATGACLKSKRIKVDL